MRFWGKRRRKPTYEIDPDEVLLDASNLPGFNQSQFEGRIVQPVEPRSFNLFLTITGLVFLFFLYEAFSLQILQGEDFAAASSDNRLTETTLFADRGVVYDRNGEVLVFNEPVENELFGERVYPEYGFSHVLGYVTYPKRDSAGFFFSEEIEGVTGIEETFNDRLEGENGLLLTEVNALGDVQSSGEVLQPLPGENITLSLDARLQRILYEEIAALSERIPFVGGAGVIMDVQTGEVIALASYPEFSSNVLSNGENAEIAVYQGDSRTPFLNRVISGQYTPGSVVKPFVATAALEEDVVDQDDTFVSTGAISIPNPYVPSQPSIFRDWKAHGVVNVERALSVSSNVFFYIIGGGFEGQEGLGIERLKRWYSMFGFGEETGVSLPNEVAGFVPDPAWKEDTFGEPWRIGNTYYTAIGQYAMQLTPLQVVRGMAALANGGRLLVPSLEIGGGAGGRSVQVSAETRAIVLQGMRDAVEEGTAQGLNVSYVDVAAKTGTAELGAQKQFVNAWVTGFFPYEEPKYAFVVVMERGPVKNTIGGVSVMRTFLDRVHREVPEYFSTE